MPLQSKFSCSCCRLEMEESIMLLIAFYEVQRAQAAPKKTNKVYERNQRPHEGDVRVQNQVNALKCVRLKNKVL